MGKLYNFVRLINKYSNTFELITESEGAYVNGKWQAGLATVTEMEGAIIPLSESKIYQSGGTLKKTDRQLYTTTPITDLNAKIRYKGKTYSIEEDTNWEDYADAYFYILKWVNSFDRSETN